MADNGGSLLQIWGGGKQKESGYNAHHDTGFMHVHNTLMRQLTSPQTVNSAWQWLCHRRKHYPADADIWDFRWHKNTQLPLLIHQLRSGCYRFSPLQGVTKANGEKIALWSSHDALVLKLLALVLQPVLPCHKSCAHLQGHGGAKRVVQATHDRITSKQFIFVVRTDIKGYYANINKHQCLEQLASVITCPIVLQLLSQYLFYCVEQGGTFHTPNKGISRGCALSPLIAGFQLYCIDRHFAQQKHLRYARYMDDFLILCKTRHHCRQAVLTLNQFFNHFGFRQHPDKTYIGRIEKGFDFLGYLFDSTGLTAVSPRSRDNFSNKRHQLYEQARCASEPLAQTQQRVMVYTNRWCRWASSGLSDAVACRLRQAWNYARPWDDSMPLGMPTA